MAEVWAQLKRVDAAARKRKEKMKAKEDAKYARLIEKLRVWNENNNRKEAERQAKKRQKEAEKDKLKQAKKAERLKRKAEKKKVNDG